jgi:hypothetical protein
MAEKGCSIRAVLEALVKRTELSMLMTGIPLAQAIKAGGMQKLLPVLTTASYLRETRLKQSMNDLANLGSSSLFGVLAPRAFNRKLTAPNLLNRLELRTSSSGTKKCKEAASCSLCARAYAYPVCPPPPANTNTSFDTLLFTSFIEYSTRLLSLEIQLY